MRTRTLLAGATFALGIGAASTASAQLLLKGSDTLELVAKDAVVGAGVSATITYVGGGSGTGQAAMTATTPTQQIAPMSRQLNGTACTTLGTTIGQELIGLDGISVVAANQVGADSQELGAPTDPVCNDNITGGLIMNVPAGCTAADGCDGANNYTFADWKDVLSMVYAGQNHTTAPTLISGARNPARINCAGNVRRQLVDNYGNLFSTGTGTVSCRTGGCTKLRHAFRRDDLSGTTDTFVTLLGLVAIPPYTTSFTGTPTFLPAPDASATANAFCNAGEGLMNKGDSDYLDLDPIRRAVDGGPAPSRIGFEQVGEAGLPQFGGNNNDASCTVAGNIPTNSAVSSVPNLLPTQVGGDHTAALQAELGFPGGGSAVIGPTTRVCLGVVLPVTVPANYGAPDAYFGASADGVTPPTACSVDATTGSVVMAVKTLDNVFSGSLCTDGKPQPCRVPVNNSTGTNNFNCYIPNLNPGILPLRDNRGFHLHPVTGPVKTTTSVAGFYNRDNFSNPNIPLTTIPANRQARVVTAFFRLHFNQVTTLNGSVPTLPGGSFCTRLDSTDQIGCLVKANACSIGYAGRESVDPVAVGGKNFAFRLNDVAPSVAKISNLFTGGLPVYPLSRGLYVNSVKGFANVTGDELTLLTFMRTPTSIDPIISAHNFINVPGGVTRSTGCPRP
jgi:ABC-type phosphate transport system substrate-binding protein